MKEKKKDRRTLAQNKYSEYFQSPIRLVHATPSLKKILNTKAIFPSGGGLGAAIYCIPLDRKMHPHNMFEVFYSYQIPKKTKGKIDLLLFELKLPAKSKQNVKKWGVDYTTFGKKHLKTWIKIKKSKIVSKEYQKNLENKVVKQVSENIKLINSIIYDKNTNNQFEKKYTAIFSNIPALRFIIYETMCEFILLFQNDTVSLNHLKKNELFNLYHKRMVFDLCPPMEKKFRMMSFFISLSRMADYIERKKMVKPFKRKDFYSFFNRRIAFYLEKIIKGRIKEKYSFVALSHDQPDMVGHILYREFFNKTLFEQNLAEFILDEYRIKGIICPFYSILPKGEVGINPYCQEMGAKVKVYIAHYNKAKNVILLGKKLNVRLEKSIISEKESTIR